MSIFFFSIQLTIYQILTFFRGTGFTIIKSIAKKSKYSYNQQLKIYYFVFKEILWPITLKNLPIPLVSIY